MSTYTASPTYTAACDLPDDGDDADAASVNVGLECALDNAAYLYTNCPKLGASNAFTSTNTFTSLTMTGTNKVSLASRSISRVQESMPVWDSATNIWNLVALSGTLLNVTGAGILYIPIHAPHGSTITAVSVKINPPAHGGTWPPTAPALKLYWTSYSSGASGQVGSTATDSVAVQATYEAAHEITISGLSEVVDRTGYFYTLLLASESGGNWVTGTIYHGCTVTYTTTAYDED